MMLRARRPRRLSFWRGFIRCAFGLAVPLLLLTMLGVAATFPYRLAVAIRVPQPPKIDADPADWLKEKPIVVGPGSQVLTGDLVYTGAEDLSARFYLMWDREWLYVAGEVIDDSVTSGEAWDTDRVNLVFDMNNDTDRFTYSSSNPGTSEWQVDDYWVFCRPFVGADSGQVFRIARDAYGEIDGARLASVRTSVGYRFEMAVPVKALPGLVPNVGKVVGFDLFVTDGDGEPEITEIMWANRWDYDTSGISWQWWKLDRLVFADHPIRP